MLSTAARSTTGPIDRQDEPERAPSPVDRLQPDSVRRASPRIACRGPVRGRCPGPRATRNESTCENPGRACPDPPADSHAGCPTPRPRRHRAAMRRSGLTVPRHGNHRHWCHRPDCRHGDPSFLTGELRGVSDSRLNSTCRTPGCHRRAPRALRLREVDDALPGSWPSEARPVSATAPGDRLPPYYRVSVVSKRARQKLASARDAPWKMMTQR